MWLSVPSPARTTTTDGRADHAGQVGHRPGTGVRDAHRDEQAARPLDEHQVVLGGQLPDRVEARPQRQRRLPGDPGGGQRGQRVAGSVASVR